jgi:hypothetical protein
MNASAGGVEVGNVGAPAQHQDARMGPGVAFADDHELGRGYAVDGGDGGLESLAAESAADEEQHVLGFLEADLVPDEPPRLRARLELGGVDAVVDHGDLLGRHAVVADHLVLHPVERRRRSSSTRRA